MEYMYKFKNINFLFDSIQNDSIYLSSPFDFNDPLDSYFCTLLGRSRDSTVELVLNEYITISKSLRVFCGTTDYNINNILMWSHYADFHKGVLIKYKVPKKLQNKVNKVDYQHIDFENFLLATGNGNPFNVPHKSSKEKQDLVLKSAYQKNNEWQYEGEVRYVCFLKKEESFIEKGWKVDEVYIGYNYLNNSNEKLEELLRIIELCIEKKIKIFTMSFSYDNDRKQFSLNPDGWMKQEHILEIENYNRIQRAIYAELRNRLLQSTNGIVLKSVIEDIAKEQYKKMENDKIRYTSLLNNMSYE